MNINPPTERARANHAADQNGWSRRDLAVRKAWYYPDQDWLWRADHGGIAVGYNAAGVLRRASFWPESRPSVPGSAIELDLEGLLSLLVTSPDTEHQES